MRFLTSGRGEREHSMRGTHARTHVPWIALLCCIMQTRSMAGGGRGGQSCWSFVLVIGRRTKGGRWFCWDGITVRHCTLSVNNTRESIMTTWSWCDCDKCLSGT